MVMHSETVADDLPVTALSDSALADALEQGDYELVRSATNHRIEKDPQDARAYYFRGLMFLQEGEAQQAEGAFSQAVEIAPERFATNLGLGIALLEQGKYRQARLSLEKARDVGGDEIPLLYQLARLEVSAGRWDAAIAALGRLAEKGFVTADTDFLMGLSFRAKERFSMAKDYMLRAAEKGKKSQLLDLIVAICDIAMGDVNGYGKIDDLLVNLPEDRDSLFQLATECQRQGLINAADSFYKEFLAKYPDDLKGSINYGELLTHYGRGLEALYHFQNALEVYPDDAELNYRVGLVQQFCLRDKEKSLDLFQKAIASKPDHAQALVHAAALLKERGKIDEAKALLRQAIDSDPDDLQAFLNLAEYLKESGEFEEAFSVLVKAKSHPEAATEEGELHVLQAEASALLRYGDMEPALRAYRDLSMRETSNPSIHSSLLFCLNYDYRTTESERAKLYRDYDRYMAGLCPANLSYKNTLDPDRRLKIGYISGDFRGHSVGFFAEPILASHNHDQFEIYCYSNVMQVDEVTRRMIPCADQWRWINDLPDEAVIEMIRMDGIDIIIDLSNHTAYNRLSALARRPAPIQMTWIGMPTTTGMSAIDYRITDARMDPVGMTDRLHSEKLLRLPSSGWCYRPSSENAGIDVGPLPARRNGHLTFASFNAFGKINRKVVEVWGRMLRELPGAILYMATGGREDDEKRNDLVLNAFKDWGFPVEQLRLFGRKEFQDYCRFHQEIDIALDPFPYNGGTVTAHSLWMGVPVLTLAGKAPIQRMGVSMMTSVGYPEFIAETEDEYIAIAKRFAGDLDRLAEIRKRLRVDMQLSPLMDARLVTRELEDSFRQVWKDWCGKRQLVRRS